MAQSEDVSEAAIQPGGVVRLLTCGSVDDGKSTLIGRLLFDTGSIPDDQLLTLRRDSARYGTTKGEYDFALLLDGLAAEREQGITIDIAYRYFKTSKGFFILADAPGHEQYTRNMATAASTADVAILLVDAKKGIRPQTRRHFHICALLGLKRIILAVNKLDLFDYAQSVFDQLVNDFKAVAASFDVVIDAVPISALEGENITTASLRTSWYKGRSILEILEAIEPRAERSVGPFRFAVQWINRPSADVRGLSGTVASGRVEVGDLVELAISGRQTSVVRIIIMTFEGDVASAEAGDAVTLILADELDVPRGELLSHPHSPAHVADQLTANVIWFSDNAMLPGRSYLMRVGHQFVPASFVRLVHKLDVNSNESVRAEELRQNDIGFCHLSTAGPVAFDPYSVSRESGSFILIDRVTNETAGAGMIVRAIRHREDVHAQAFSVTKAARSTLMGHKPGILWFTGLSGAGKSTIADVVEAKLHGKGIHTYSLDGDNTRLGLSRDLGFTDADRVENIRRVGEVARLFVDSGLIVLCSFISPFGAERNRVRELVGKEEFVEIFVDTPLEICMMRDPKGLYAKARTGDLMNFTGVTSPYEVPLNPEIWLKASSASPEVLADVVLRWMERRDFFR